MKDIQSLKDFLRTSRKIVVTTHANPDADALGSSLGMYHFMVDMGHEVSTIVPNSYPNFLNWMPGNSVVINYEQSKIEADMLLKTCELLFCLDFSSFTRLKDMSHVVPTIHAKVALIDHHLNPEIKSAFNFWNDSAAATAELVYDFIVDYSGKKAIDKKIAECLYAGIMTDTGSFRHSNTTSKIHRIVAELIDLGVDVNKVSRSIYDTNSLQRLKFIGHAIVEKLYVDEQCRVAYFIIGKHEFNEFRLEQGDTEGLVNYALSIKGVVMAAIIIERENEIKLSFRSIGNFSVNKFAEKYFNGGGHKNAAGGSSVLSLQETEKKFRDLIAKNVLTTKET